MTSYNFNTMIDRKNSSSVKWGMMDKVYGDHDLLPMWVADMDFEPPLEVKQAIKERLDHGIFGYTYVPSSTTDAVKDWLKNRHGWEIDASWVVYHSGIVPALATCIQSFTNEGDKILVHNPVYSPFFDLVKKNNRTPVYNELQLVNNRFEINFEDFEKQLQDGVKMFILCSPHNPGGRVWTKEELTKIAELCKKYKCLLISDEIHSDLVYQHYKHIPISSINAEYQDLIITCVAPSKTFNLAGLQASAIIIPNKKLRESFQATLAKQGFFSLNTFGIVGMEAAYRYGKEWLDELLEYLEENINIVKEFISTHLPSISVMEPEGTYLLWLDLRKLNLTDEEIKQRLLEKGKLALEPGTKYGSLGKGFVRMNLACPREMVMDGLQRLKKALS